MSSNLTAPTKLFVNKKVILEIIGWYGAAAIICAYFLNSFSLVADSSVAYQLLNVTGAIGVALISYGRRAYQPLALNVIWAVIGAAALLRILTRV